MRIAFFLSKHAEVEYNTGLKVIEYLDEDEKIISEMVKDYGYPILTEIPIRRYDPSNDADRINLVSISDKGKDTNDLFIKLILSFGAKYHGMKWSAEPEDFIIMQLIDLQERFPRIRVIGRQWYIYTIDISEDVLNMISNFDNM